MSKHTGNKTNTGNSINSDIYSHSQAVDVMLNEGEAAVLALAMIDAQEAHVVAMMIANAIDEHEAVELAATQQNAIQAKQTAIEAIKAGLSFLKPANTASNTVEGKLLAEASERETRRDTTVAQVLLDYIRGTYSGKCDIVGLTDEVSNRRGKSYKQSAMRRAVSCIEQRQCLKISLRVDGKAIVTARGEQTQAI